MFALKIIWLSMIYVTPITKVIIAPATETYRLDFQRCQSNPRQFFRFFCWQYNAAFSLYWVTSNLYSIVTYLCFNLYADRQSKKKALQAK